MALKRWLIDTGPLVAYFDQSDSAHDAIAASIDGFSGQLFTTDAVVTEVMYFLSESIEGVTAFAEFLTASDTQVGPLTQPDTVNEAVELMRKYADTPMDFADATLVLAARQTGILDILTLDRRGFSTYRPFKNRAFRLVH